MGGFFWFFFLGGGGEISDHYSITDVYLIYKVLIFHFNF